MMYTENCLNLCELGSFPRLETVIAEIKEKIAFSRIYLGSYFCDELFLKTEYEKIIEMAEKMVETPKFTLVLPVFSQKHQCDGKEKAMQLIKQYEKRIDELTVNDYGMLRNENFSGFSESYFSETFQTLKINLGRLFFKDYREPRYEDYFETVWTPEYFTDDLRHMINREQINAIDIDITHKKLDLSEAPECIIGIHTPYTYMTTGKICEFASQYCEVKKKFRPNMDCGVECKKVMIAYGIEEGRKWYRVGRCVYFENSSIKISVKEKVRKEGEGLSENAGVRMIYFPLNEFVSIC